MVQPTSVTATTAMPSTVDGPIVLTVTGLTPGQVVQIYRDVGDVQERRVGQFAADPAGTVVYRDLLYPFGAPVGYSVYNSDATAVLAVVAPNLTPDSVVPWIRDMFVPELLSAPTTIVDVTARTRGGRVTVYRVIAQKFPTTLGDVRQASEGTLTLLCPDHIQRDRVIATLSSGYPCSLRVPSGCRGVVDDMYFTPLDIAETRFGKNGACTLDVDFVEVETADLPQYQPVAYSTQTANALTNGDMRYSDLAINFVGESYADLYLSPNGITP